MRGSGKNGGEMRGNGENEEKMGEMGKNWGKLEQWEWRRKWELSGNGKIRGKMWENERKT